MEQEEIVIEKVSKYMKVTASSRSTETIRHVLLSLPRVRWLERDPDYVSEYSEIASVTISEQAPTSATPWYKRQLTQKEALVYKLRREGVSSEEISKTVGLGLEATRSYFARAKRKMMEQNNKK